MVTNKSFLLYSLVLTFSLGPDQALAWLPTTTTPSVGPLTRLAPTSTTMIGTAFRSRIFVGEAKTSSTALCAGFGGGDKKKKKRTIVKLKPKSQWDRFLDMKGAQRVRVAVRVMNNDDDNDWLEVGNVKSQDNQYTALAVARQRALIAEVRKEGKQ